MISMNLICRGFVLFCLCFCYAVGAASAVPVSLTPNGSLKIDELTFSVQCFRASDWALSSQEMKVFQVKECSGDAANFRLDGLFRIPGLPEGTLRETWREEGEDHWNYHAEMNFVSAADLAQLALSTSMPVERFYGRELLIDGKKVTLPQEYQRKQGNQIYSGVAREVILPIRRGKLIFRGNFRLYLQDDRAYQGRNYAMRLLFTPFHGRITRTALDLSIAFEPYRSTPLDLSAVVNMGFADEKADDRRGGWTDQGADNDLRMIPVGRQRWAGVEFEILDPSKNGGKSCLMLAGPSRGYFPEKAVALQSNPVRGKCLYLLHALAWPVDQKQIGTVTVRYSDGSKREIPVTGGVDVGNWWEAIPRRNGEVVWTGENRSSFVGLYCSAFPIDGKPVKAIEFQSTGRSVWGIVGASVASEKLPRLAPPPVYITAGKEWQPIVYHKDFQKGSILDFSGRLDAPAGKYGPVVVKGEKLVFRDRPDVPVRFYGTNLCKSSQYLSREWAERLADRLAALGYNAVRFHHHDGSLVRHRAGERLELNPERLDQLDYLMACLKKRGIYYTTDLYVSRSLRKGEIPEFPDHIFYNRTFKAMVFVLDSAMENWKSFAGKWLCHVNPYTNVALKDDPALLSLSMINEDNIASWWNATPESSRLYREQFERWKREKGIRDGRAELADVHFSRFLVELYDRRFQEMKQFVRGLGVKTILSDQNMQCQELLSVMRRQYDYVDNHFYWAHPKFPEKSWRLPSIATAGSALAAEARCPALIAPTRLLDKPMTITEFDYAKPNFFRAEGAVLTGAYAALQDWDALFQFAYAHSREKVMQENDVSGYFDTLTDPVKSFAQRIGVRLFLDRELKTAPVAFAAVLTGGEGMNFIHKYSAEINRLALIARVGTLIAPEGRLGSLPADTAGLLNLGRNFPAGTGSLPVFSAASSEKKLLEAMTAAGVLKPGWYDPAGGIFRASNGQITLDSRRQTFQVTTPGCEVLILPAKMQGSASFLKVKNRVGRAVFSVMSMDKKTLAESGRMLLLHLTDSQASRVKFHNSRLTQMEQWGVMPFLAARGEAEIELAAAPGNYTLYAVDTAGKRLREIPVSRTGSGALRFSVKVFSKQGAVFAYELLRR